MRLPIVLMMSFVDSNSRLYVHRVCFCTIIDIINQLIDSSASVIHSPRTIFFILRLSSPSDMSRPKMPELILIPQEPTDHRMSAPQPDLYCRPAPPALVKIESNVQNPPTSQSQLHPNSIPSSGQKQQKQRVLTEAPMFVIPSSSRSLVYNMNQQQQIQTDDQVNLVNKYGQLLSVIQEMSRDLRPMYTGSRTSIERFKRNITTARSLVTECMSDTDNHWGNPVNYYIMFKSLSFITKVSSFH